MRNNHIRTYSELIQLRTFEERYEYLRLNGSLGVVTFGFDRYLNQRFYNSMEWKNLRREIIIRDGACDLAIEGRDILDGIRIHHLNVITIEDFERGNYDILDPEFLICCSLNTHNAIHFGDKRSLIQLPRERRKGDTIPWRQY